MKSRILFFTLLLISVINANAQWVNNHTDWIYNFTPGTPGTYDNIISPATTANGDLNTTFLPAPPSGTPLLFIVKGNVGPFILDSSSFPNSLIMYPSDKVNKFGVYNIDNASSVAHMSFSITLDSTANTVPPNSMIYNWSIGNSSSNNGNVYQSRNSIYTANTAFKGIFSVLRLIYNSTNKNYVMSYRVTGSPTTAAYTTLSNAGFLGGVKYKFDMYCNNYTAKQSYTGPDGSTDTVPPGTFHIWATNGSTSDIVRVSLPAGGGYDIPRSVETATSGDASIVPDTSLNAFVFQGGANTTQAGFAIIDGGIKISYLTPAGLLPVSFISNSFKGQLIDNAVQLSWKTASEQNNAYFEVLRSTDGKKFNVIGKEAGHLTTNLQQNYSFVDDNPISGANYYKLKQVDLDGKTTYNSDIVVVNVAQQQNAFKAYVSGGQLKATAYSATAENAVLKVFSVSGQQVSNTNIKLNQGINTFNVDLSSLQTGVYIAVLNRNGQDEVVKFMK